MSTTPSDGGSDNATTTQDEAGIQPGDMIISQDDNGTPTLVPAETAQETTPSEESQNETEEEAAPSPEKTTTVDEATAQANTETDDEVVAWAEKKGLKINPENPNEVKLARMQLENDRRFHENQQKPKIQPPEPIEASDGVNEEVVERLNRQELQTYVRDWFDANPDMKEHRTELQSIADQRPWLQDLDDVKAHFLASNPNRDTELRTEGGRKALENLASKQSQVPPQASATNGGSYDTAAITPTNVYDLIDRNDQEWFQKNYSEINKAISGK